MNNNWYCYDWKITAARKQKAKHKKARKGLRNFKLNTQIIKKNGLIRKGIK